MMDTRRCARCGGVVPPDAPGGECPGCLLEAGLAPAEKGKPTDPPPTSIEELNQLFPTLEVEALIGQGGMGWVYKARQQSLDRPVALKILPRKVAEEPAFRERFNRESRALARLDHPNIISVHESGEAKGFYFFIMEYVDGINLRQAQKEGRLSPRETLAVVAQICDALQYAHDQGIVHRDIKPENIMLSRDGKVKIADFGLAKLLRPAPGDITLTGDEQVMGTYHYMAPEQIQSAKNVDHRADIYSLGVVFYEMLTGDLPLGRFPPPSEKVEVDVRLDHVVLRALEKERERRYQRAAEVKTEMNNIREGGAAPPSMPKYGAPSTERRMSYLAVAGILLLPGALLVALVTNEFVARDETAMLIGVAVAVMGFVFSALGWSAIRANPDRLNGLKIAKAGVFIPLGAALVFFVVSIPAYFLLHSQETVARSKSISEQESALRQNELRIQLGRINRARTVKGLLEAVDPRQRSRLRSMPDDERKRQGAAMELGLAFIDMELLPVSLSEYKFSGYSRSGDKAHQTIFCRDEVIRFPVVRVNGTWYLGVGKVERWKIE